ncbi:uncharacterized protein H6S33_004681 [Morchella sextelata]|uniref:uncharacterized protein n=1 Tax=Morchella sextelata TaxID=1174677 RepID=UPI001D0462E9|nr:uncharacterized protein H6S33_004681 [Morchella sextelata]KAH0605459.1 hypothetical protein H6S33_004681 [Morchella sextelata]
MEVTGACDEIYMSRRMQGDWVKYRIWYMGNREFGIGALCLRWSPEVWYYGTKRIGQVPSVSYRGRMLLGCGIHECRNISWSAYNYLDRVWYSPGQSVNVKGLPTVTETPI